MKDIKKEMTMGKIAAPKGVKADKVGHKQLKVTQMRSAIGNPADQQGTLKGLGLRKIRGVSFLEDTASVRGMIAKVGHLVKFEKL